MTKPFNFGALNAKTLDNPWYHWFFYGETGSGKTSLAATFPRPVFLIPFNENSIETLRGKDVPFFIVTDKDNKPFNPKTGEGSMVKILDHIEKGYHHDPEGFPYDTIVFESLSHYGDLVQEQLTKGDQHMDQQKWGFFLAHFRQVQSRMRNLDVHVIFTALAKMEKADGTSREGGPAIPGQAAVKLPSACDVIGYCEEKKGIYTVHFRSHRGFKARSRLPLPDKVQDFNFAKIEEKYLLKRST